MGVAGKGFGVNAIADSDLASNAHARAWPAVCLPTCIHYVTLQLRSPCSASPTHPHTHIGNKAPVYYIPGCAFTS